MTTPSRTNLSNFGIYLYTISDFFYNLFIKYLYDFLYNLELKYLYLHNLDL